MHFERLTIEAQNTEFSLDLDRHMTVIAGVGPLERDGLINELIGALDRGRPGVHIDLGSDAGTRFTISRPVDAPHRVTDVDNALDVTNSFTVGAGKVNLLERSGLALESARSAIRMTAGDLTTRSQSEERILTLAQVNQARLWDVATKVKEREAKLNEAAAELANDPDDVNVLAEIEQRHNEADDAEERHEKARSISLLVGVNLTVMAIPLTMIWGFAAAVPALVGALGLTIWSAVHWQRAERARKNELNALGAAGAESYISFQISRVNGLLADDRQRREAMRLAEYHRAALSEWHVLAGDVSVDWAIAHTTEIKRAASRLRDTVPTGNTMASKMSEIEGVEADLTHGLQQRLAMLRTLGAGGESFPLLLDEPFASVPPEVIPRLMHRLMEAATHQQVIILTADDAIADWARVAPTTQVKLIEPTTTSHRSHTSTPNRTHFRRIGVA